MQVFYNPQMRSNLKVQFPGVERIEHGYSNLCQDMFVMSLLDAPQNGTYLEVGGELPIAGNNTYLMERYYGWKGVSIELDPKYTNMWARDRRNTYINHDALTIDYNKLLSDLNLGPVIDYFSCDIEPPHLTLQALKTIDHDRYRFRVITFEHDTYNGGTGPETRTASRKFLNDLGYQLVVGDVSHAGNSVEDWWAAPELVDQLRLAQLTLATTWNADEAIFTSPQDIRQFNRRPF